MTAPSAADDAPDDDGSDPDGSSASAGRTVWARSVAGQLGSFLRTESGSSGVLVAAIVVALIWENVGAGSYEALWGAPLSIRIGDLGIAMDLRAWVSSGLMTLFFLVVGLEARREFDLGALRDRTQVAIPFAAGLVGMALPVLIFLAVNAGGDGMRGWGVAMSTDTALALGLLTLLGRNLPERVRGFLLTVFIVDDLVALIVIAVAYSSNVQFVPLLVAVLAFAIILLGHRLRFPKGLTVVLAILSWGALLFSGVDPVVIGLALGLSTPAFVPARGNLEEATGLFRRFREQPTPELARSASAGLRATLSPNERLQSIYHPWTSYVIVPLFALANAGIHIDGAFLATAVTAPITLGVFFGYVIGKPVAVAGTAWIVTRLSRGRFRPPVGWAAVIGSGTIAGVGFTVAVLVATLAFSGDELAQAKVGILAAAVGASVLTWIVYRITALLPDEKRALALLGRQHELVDLTAPVDPARDHVRGPRDASVTVVEYGDFQCPYCGKAEPSVRELITDVDIRFVWRHLPLSDVHPQAALAAEAAEAAAVQGAFWAMHDLLLAHQDQLRLADLSGYAEELGIDVDRFSSELSARVHRMRVAEDVDSADLSGVAGTPTFFINGLRHYGAYDVESLRAAVVAARDQAAIARAGR
jgi:Na+/H+ antiporter NhaA